MTSIQQELSCIQSTPRNDMCYCPGCSHAAILEKLGLAIDRLGLRHDEVCIVSDIGCIGTADKYFDCHTFHGLHGRSLTYAEGIKRSRPEMTVIVLIGDGGCGIGTAHLVHSARRHAGIKVIVCNNFNFGMTGGQHSVTTPTGMLTTTTPGGVTEHPFDICRTVIANGAAHAGRFSALDPACGEQIEALLRTDGFGLLDLWELCVAYFVPENRMKPGSLAEISSEFDLPFGLLHSEFHNGSSYSGSPEPALPERAPVKPAQRAIQTLSWPGRTEICIAGSAGQRIRSAAGVVGEIAVASGLFAAQLDDFPITVRKGFSLSYLIISDRPIRYSAVDEPDLLVVLSAEGQSRFGALDHLKPECHVIVDSSVSISAPAARLRRVDMRLLQKQTGGASAALGALAAGISAAGWIDPVAFMGAARESLGGRYREANLQAIEIGVDLWRDTDQSHSAARQRGLP